MEDKNSELLFEYLRSILYDKKIQPLDVEQLDEPFRKLGRGLQYFAKTFTETKQYAAALSRGNLSVQPPPREFFVRKFKKYPCKSKSSDLAGKTGGKG